MNQIVIDAWKELSKLRSNSISQPYVVDTMPILYFGDIEAYEGSDIKVITVAINPSDLEFRKKKSGKFGFFRFPLSESLEGINPIDLNQGGIENYLKSLNKYFDEDKDPYWEWFKKNEPLLKGIGAS